ncbi:hypothetical protein [Silvanigrella aquatica]|uniref:Uncharacterized protein n=1 Tax=Silvanigrella aquatica TaxID=1915309 RepID=A0A1L4D2C4_9BACT|nr:hypothetical protein [Silvanigrella aquatica]APJ04340.1 hypothetical protein AXG55_10655 [Silvanigrella aquatica]
MSSSDPEKPQNLPTPAEDTEASDASQVMPNSVDKNSESEQTSFAEEKPVVVEEKPVVVPDPQQEPQLEVTAEASAEASAELSSSSEVKPESKEENPTHTPPPNDKSEEAGKLEGEESAGASVHAIFGKSKQGVEAGIITLAISFINEYEKYGLTDYLKLIEELEKYAKDLVEQNNTYKSYRITKSKSHLNRLVYIKSLPDRGAITEEECSLAILDFIEEFDKI